jgi:Bacterial SH3 domain
VPTFKQMAIRAGHATTRSTRYALGPSAELPIARVVACLLIVLAIAAVWLVFNAARAAPSPAVSEIASLDPRSVLTDNSPHFLPTPVAALPPNVSSSAATSSTEELSAADTAPERVKVANTGGVGAILRTDPPTGKQVTALRDGTALDVLERRTLADGAVWLHVKTADGTDGWIYSRLTASAD